MSIVSSLGISEEVTPLHHTNHVEPLVNQLLDEIIVKFSSLIADIEERKVEPELLKFEIKKLVDRQKGYFNLEAVKLTLFNTIYGYGDLQKYVDHPDITDIDGTTFDYLTIRKKGKIQRIPNVFESEKAFERFCKLIIIRNGGVINEIDNHCRVSDSKNNLRINVCIEPRNLSGTSLSIRKHNPVAYTLEELLALEFLDQQALNCIIQMCKTGKSILISGKGGAGKTTLLRTIIEQTPIDERILICESDVEIAPQRKNCISQSIKKLNLGGRVVTLNDLIKDGLTMSLDTYCIGELTGSEAWSFLMAGSTDHRILGTIHANSAEETITRLMMLIEKETRLNENYMSQIVHQSVDYIIYISNFKVIEIIELQHNLNNKKIYKRGGDYAYVVRDAASY